MHFALSFFGKNFRINRNVRLEVVRALQALGAPMGHYENLIGFRQAYTYLSKGPTVVDGVKLFASNHGGKFGTEKPHVKDDNLSKNLLFQAAWNNGDVEGMMACVPPAQLCSAMRGMEALEILR